jgi:hypothetical protein
MFDILAFASCSVVLQFFLQFTTFSPELASLDGLSPKLLPAAEAASVAWDLVQVLRGKLRGMEALVEKCRGRRRAKQWRGRRDSNPRPLP